MKTCEENDLGVHDRTEGMKFLMNLHDLKGKLNNRGGQNTGFFGLLFKTSEKIMGVFQSCEVRFSLRKTM